MTRASAAYPPGAAGVHFSDPTGFAAYAATVANINAYDSAGTIRTGATTAFFTEMARRGLQEQTDWTSNTYKTLLNVSSGKGRVAHVIGCTAGGAETTTFEITVDGALYTIPVVLASGQRAWLSCGALTDSNFIQNGGLKPGAEALNAGKSTFSEVQGTGLVICPWYMTDYFATPMLRFTTSLLIRAKHSATITNSTATAYSAIMYRLGAGT